MPALAGAWIELERHLRLTGESLQLAQQFVPRHCRMEMAHSEVDINYGELDFRTRVRASRSKVE
jgi:hypothetical protein